MRCILRMLVVLAIASPAWAAQDIGPNTVPSQEPFVSTRVPNIHAPGAPVVTGSPASSAYQTPASAPTTTDPASLPATRYSGNYVVNPFNAVGTQAGTTTAAPMSNTTYTPYYYYPMRTRFRLFRRATPTYTYAAASPSPTYGTVTYNTASPTYYTPVQRRGLFGFFQRRYRPVYQTTVYNGAASTPPVYTPTTYTAPAGTVTSGTVPAGTTPVYTPTTYTIPTGTAPAGAVPAGTSPAGTAPSVTAPAGLIPARTIPPAPPIRP